MTRIDDSWKKFKQTYKWTLRHYPATETFYGSKWAIDITTQRYKKDGKEWVLTSEETEKAKDGTFYMNCVDAVPFFRKWSGKEIVITGYTKAGNIPVEIQSFSPDRTEKIVRKFEVYDRFRPDKSLEYLGF